MKFLQITNRIPFPLDDGGNIANWNVLNEMKKAGNSVTLLSMNTTKHFCDPEVMYPVVDKVVAVNINTDITILGAFTSLFSGYPYIVKRFINEEFGVALMNLLKTNHFDVIQLEGIFTAVYIHLIRRYSKAKLILRAHNVEYIIWDRYYKDEKNIFKKIFLFDMTRRLRKFEFEHFRLFDAIIALTYEDEQLIRKSGYSNQLEIIPLGVNTDKFFPLNEGKKDTQEIVIGFIGSLEWLPNLQGIEWFLENVWPQVKLKSPNARFRLAGKKMPEKLKQLAITGFEPVGYVKDAAEFTRSLDIFVVPLLSGGGMRIKILEAMACGKCVISTRIGAEGIQAEHEKEIILADSPEEMLQHLLILAGNKEKVATIGKNAELKIRQSYTWPVLIQKMLHFYNSVK